MGNSLKSDSSLTGDSDKRIVVGCDHGGLALKYEMMRALAGWGYEIDDVGVGGIVDGRATGLRYDEATGTLQTVESVDYPDYAAKLGQKIQSGEHALGLLICGSGIGICISANKMVGIRAALCSEPYSARMARLHNNANVLCMGGRTVGPEVARTVLEAFLETEFEGGRHARRVDKIAAIESQRGESKS
ncbi:MAG: ribose 5-phosphate isomerase B [Myxococcales bacterium]|nr:ribose 5-phosphate isomerase B [Myxococcales bacterium]